MISVPKHLTPKNGLNVLAVALLAITMVPWDLGPDMDWLNRAEDFGRFETILTPSEGIFFFPKIVLMFEVVFGIVQLLPRYAPSLLVQSGVCYYFGGAAILQLFTSIFFSKAEGEGAAFWLFLSLVCMGAMTAALLKILIGQSSISNDESEESEPAVEDYWLLRFPFSLHAGWNIGIFIVSVNNLFKVMFEEVAWLQAIIAFISLAGFGAIAAKMLLFNGTQPNYVIPAVLAFFTFGIAIDFRGPGIEDQFAGWVVVMFILISTILCLGIAAGTSFLLYKELKDPEEDVSSDEYQGSEMVTTAEAGREKDSAMV